MDPQKHDLIDPGQQLSREDYRTIHAVPPQAATKLAEPAIPDLAPILAAPQPPKIGQSKLVSITVTDDVPLKDVLIELARLADVDIEVDASITGGIAFRAKDRPFNEVVERIADLAGLRYKMKGGVLRMERDTPYIQVYALDFINVDRSVTGSSGTSDGSSSSSSSSSSSTSGAASGSSGSSGSGAGGSSTSISSQSKGDFWAQLEKAMQSIMDYKAASRTSAPSAAATPVPATAGAATTATPAAPATAAPAAPVEKSFFVLNRQAGTLTVSATERQHDIVRRYLKAMQANTSTQALIEAKIVEVTLNERYQSGINWARFGNNGINYQGVFNTVGSSVTGSAPATINVLASGIFGNGNDLSLAVNLLEEFGTTRALSSPRLHAMNNQQAVLNFTQDLIYFNVQVDTTDAVLPSTTNPNGTPAKVTVTSTKEIQPIGITLTLQPSIDKDTGEITMNIQPTITKLLAFISDPGFKVSLAYAISKITDTGIQNELKGIESKVPQVEKRQLDSVVKIKSGQAMVIGGLLEDQNTNDDAGVPGVSEVPWFGNLFKSVDKHTTRKELVIFLRATIVDSGGSADAEDRAVYQKFMQDPRPLDF